MSRSNPALSLKKGVSVILQYPINVSPENTAKPANATPVKFTFNGDRLSYVDIRVTDMATSVQTSVWSTSEDDVDILPIYNGEEFATSAGVPYLQDGHDYIWQVMLAQRNLSGTQNLYDIPVCRGTIPMTIYAESPTTFFIDANLPIYEWGYNGNDETSYPTEHNGVVCAGMTIEMNGESRFITSYKPRYSHSGKIYGQVVIDSAFTGQITEGNRYQIMSNYLISPQYYFMSRALPEVSLTMGYGRKLQGNIEISVTGEYSQSNNTPIKYYSIDLYSFEGDVDSPTAALYKLEESGKIFSQQIGYTFQYCNEAFNKRTGEITDKINYRAICTVVTQDNVVYATYVSMHDEGVEESAPTTKDYQWVQNSNYGCVQCNYSTDPSDSTVIHYRKDLDTGKVVQALYFTDDFTASTKGHYDYITVYRKNSEPHETFLESIQHYEITTNMDGYYITALEPVSYEAAKVNNKHIYTVGDTWKFICDIDNTTIAQNMNKLLHVGYARYPSMSTTNLNYLTGTLSGMIGSLNCCNKQFRDDIALVNEWREFVSHPHPFLLKTQKGDVLIINITDNPQTEYQEDYHTIPTRFTINWAECDSLDDSFIRCDIEIDDSECPQTHNRR